jgi:Tfp pilus assembly protein PilO
MQDATTEQKDEKEIEDWKIAIMIVVLLLAMVAVLWLVDNGNKYQFGVSPILQPQEHVCYVPTINAPNTTCGA